MFLPAAEHGAPSPPPPTNEPVLNYAPGSSERVAIEHELERMARDVVDMPLVIGGRQVRTGRVEAAVMPHEHRHVLGHAHLAERSEVDAAILAAKRAWHDWSRWPWTERAAVFLKAADLLAGPWRYTLNAATMLGQSKTVHQAEIDSAAELIDFWRFNVHFMRRLYEEQPVSARGGWNRVDYRPLEGFILALTPFNFTAIAGNLPTAPALMGNTVIWKPSATAKLPAHLIMEILREAGLPDGVINLVYGDAAEIAQFALTDSSLGGIHFTGSTSVFDNLVRTLTQNMGRYRSYPRVVGETGGKNFIVAHASADLPALATAIIRGGFEYQGQKCSAASRVFVPESLWPQLRDRLCDEIGSLPVGPVTNFRNFMGAVIDKKSWLRQKAAIEAAGIHSGTRILAGGRLDESIGYFVHPTLLEVADPLSRFMTEEFFGPIVSVLPYPDSRYNDCLMEIDAASRYGLTGAVFATDRRAVAEAANALRHAAGNFYINDKPTGAVVGQQPFGGARASGTNDKAGSLWNLARWVSPRALKENFTPPTDYRYPFMAEAP